MRQTELKLSKHERKAVDAFRSKGAHMAREFNRAHILAALDRKIPEREIMEVLGVGRTAIWRFHYAWGTTTAASAAWRISCKGVHARPRSH